MSRGPPRLLAVGRMRSGGPEASLFAEYNRRLRPPLIVMEVAEARGGTPAEIRRREGAALLTALPEGALLVALDGGGDAPSSEAFAVLCGRWDESGRTPCYAIGGTEGLDPAVLAAAAHRLSLGPMTWPHLLVRGLLAEQLFRAQSIRAGHPYHRGWRP